MKIIEGLDYVKNIEIERDLTKAEKLAGIREGFEEAKLIKAGKLKGHPISELLDEL